MLLNVQLQIHHSTLRQVVRSVLHLLGYTDQRTCNFMKHCSIVDASCSAENLLE